jgi:hypothetical protein
MLHFVKPVGLERTVVDFVRRQKELKECVHNSVHATFEAFRQSQKKSDKSLIMLVGAPGLEPGTR